MQRRRAERIVHLELEVEPEAETIREHRDRSDDPERGPDGGAATRRADAHHGQVSSRSDSLTLRFPHAQIPCKGVPRYAAGRDGVRSCGAGRGLVREGAGKCPRAWGWAPPWGYP